MALVKFILLVGGHGLPAVAGFILGGQGRRSLGNDGVDDVVGRRSVPLFLGLEVLGDLVESIPEEDRWGDTGGGSMGATGRGRDP